MTHTLVAFHAHPDDEALLTAGTMARAAAEGHRVVLVIATDGSLGLAADEFTDGVNLADIRFAEAEQSAEALGVARVEWLGYADSGLDGDVPPDQPGRPRFVRAPLEEAAERLAAILRTERANVLLSYDRNGGYGHRDHVHLHQVARRAAEIAHTPRVLEATVPRDTIARAVRALATLRRFPPDFDPTTFDRAFSPRQEITHRINVRPYAAAKRAAMRAHVSQTSSNDGDRTLAAFLRVPRPLFDIVFGREWFRDPSLGDVHADGGGGIRTDIFAGLT